MKTIKHTTLALIMALSIVAVGCATEPSGTSNSNAPASPSPSSSPSPPGSVSKATAIPVTLPVLDALFADEAFKSALKSKVELTDEQLAQLQKIASEEVVRLRQLNTEEQAANQAGQADQSSQAEQARQHAA